jgi:hypothetical protein
VRDFIRQNPVLVGALAMVFAVFAYSAVAAVQQQGRCDTVDPSAWRTENNAGRDRLASDIEACSTLEGRRTADLQRLLGDPRAIARTPAPRGGTFWRYPTGGGGLDPRVLSIHVTRGGVVDEAQLTGV